MHPTTILSLTIVAAATVTVTSFQMLSPSSVRAHSTLMRMDNEILQAAEPQPVSDSPPPIRDPMGLYSANSEERKNGLIESTEEVSQPKTIYDPLSLYSSESKERKNAQIKSLEPEVVVANAVTDPLGLYGSDAAAVDSDAIMSEALPFATRPLMLTGELPGDAGFDPFGFAKSREDLMNYREAEIKHARLAMLAAAGWPLSEVFDKKIAIALHLTPLIDASDRAPSVLNGGLGKVNPFYWIAVLGAASAIEFYGTNKSKSGDESYFPGNLGFDPLGLYPEGEADQKNMQLAEIKNGRLAMIAIFGFAIQEFVSKSGVIDETPFFFRPLAETLKMYTNSGYVH
mmetsp:Transcript_16133/g.23731  ORF Transcript_16133/g.23731 Transcript_16133/m.23731 type:complete len:343 (+) Transcript_16133:115-1143(+)|eukprot:CAMPEP_0194215266 /NCGR_PEP_ID=MMETSP0156-20130528/16963_1 /TAXON_ID=33649 /ORGANISM="Thalassionema nitzschioides, Strain L26-B" /LENGTH=342 /DNA_ID=CAMNT_0038943743 /DNA_START=46 /DNA_END=1074 /DNA_ORIENTATION=-